MKNVKKIIALLSLVSFVIWTVLVCFVDVDTVGPLGSKVGFSTINSFIHDFSGVNMTLYYITDLLSVIPLFIVLVFAVVGIIQWIIRKSLFKVDKDIILLGGFYTLVFAIFLLFEKVVINYRPILIDRALEASYPSSTTMLVMFVMLTALIQINKRLKNNKFKRIIFCLIILYVFFMVLARAISGVHWFSDIIGGFFISLGLVLAYGCLIDNK